MDPEYTYVKGKGWIVRTNLIFKLQDGQNVELLVRTPVEGERYWGFHSFYDKSWFTDGEIDLRMVQKETMCYRSKDFSIWYHDSTPRPECIYVVISPV